MEILKFSVKLVEVKKISPNYFWVECFVFNFSATFNEEFQKFSSLEALNELIA